MSRDTLTELEEVDQPPDPIASKVSPAPGSNESRDAVSKRARIQADLGLPGNALADNLRAYLGSEYKQETSLSTILDAFKRDPKSLLPTKPAAGAAPAVPQYALAARLAESLRVYIRDVLLSREPQREPNLVDAIECSIFLFDQAETALRQARPNASEDDSQLTWIRAHRGAARALLFWMQLTNESSDAKKTFDDAESDFVRTALQDGKPYVWSIRFRAYLYSLQTEPGYFERARELLELVKQYDPCLQSSINRSLAMLFSYQAAAKGVDPSVRRAAARAGVNAGALAQRQDHEDYVAAYFTAANWWLLAMCEPDEQKREVHRQAQVAAIDSARTRSMNAISQGLVTLAGLELMRLLSPAPWDDLAKTSPIQDEAAMRNVLNILDSLQLVFPPDVETRLIFQRDPVWTVIRNFMHEVWPRLAPGCDQLNQYIAAPATRRT